jgi:hypothetical protein
LVGIKIKLGIKNENLSFLQMTKKISDYQSGYLTEKLMG